MKRLAFTISYLALSASASSAQTAGVDTEFATLRGNFREIARSTFGPSALAVWDTASVFVTNRLITENLEGSTQAANLRISGLMPTTVIPWQPELPFKWRIGECQMCGECNSEGGFLGIGNKIKCAGHAVGCWVGNAILDVICTAYGHLAGNSVDGIAKFREIHAGGAFPPVQPNLEVRPALDSLFFRANLTAAGTASASVDISMEGADRLVTLCFVTHLDIPATPITLSQTDSIRASLEWDNIGDSVGLAIRLGKVPVHLRLPLPILRTVFDRRNVEMLVVCPIVSFVGSVADVFRDFEIDKDLDLSTGGDPILLGRVAVPGPDGRPLPVSVRPGPISIGVVARRQP